MGAATHFAGIDVSKDTLDACLLGPDGRSRGDRFANDARGHAALLAWADRHAAGAVVHFCLEATGPYSDGVAAHLHAAGRVVSVANPARVKAHAKACGQGNKTDPADARAIATFCRDRTPRPWAPPSPEVGQLQALVRRHADLVELAAREKGRLASPALTGAERKSVERTARFLGREAAKLRAAADAVVAATPALAADRRLLESIPGVGRQTATAILAELPAADRLPSAESAAADCRLAPAEFRSGTSVRKRTRLSKAGNPRLRTALFLPARTAARFNPVVRAFYARLVAAGKPKMSAIGACMRKLVMLCYGALKNRTPFDPAHPGSGRPGGGSLGHPVAGRTEPTPAP